MMSSHYDVVCLNAVLYITRRTFDQVLKLPQQLTVRVDGSHR